MSLAQTVSFSKVSKRPIELFDGRIIPAMPELLGMREQYELRLSWLEQKHLMLLSKIP